jgi:hypothetical protein
MDVCGFLVKGRRASTAPSLHLPIATPLRQAASRPSLAGSLSATPNLNGGNEPGSIRIGRHDFGAARFGFFGFCLLAVATVAPAPRIYRRFLVN